MVLGILEGEVLGSVGVFRVVRGDFGVDLVVEREAVMVEVWVRLGGKMGVILEGVLGSGLSRTKGKEILDFSEELGRSLSVLSGWGSARKKRVLPGSPGCF